MKKIFSLVLSLIMLSCLALPVFATEPATANLFIIDDTNSVIYSNTVTVENNTLAKALKATELVTIRDNAIYSVNGKTAKNVGSTFTDGTWTVTVDGKSADLSDTITADSNIVVYWMEPIFDTKIILMDASNIRTGIVSFYYYNTTNERVPAVGAKVAIDGVQDVLVAETAMETSVAGEPAGRDYFITDEKGDIWIAPYYLDDPTAEYTITEFYVEHLTAIKESAEEYTAAQRDYFNERLDRNVISILVEGATFSPADYTGTPATGDNTLIYVAACVVAFGTVAVLTYFKKKQRT